MGYVELSPKNCTSADEALKGEEDISIFSKVLCISFIGAMVLVICMGPSTSSIYIQDVYIPAQALDTNGTTPFNASIFVDLEFQREGAVFNVLSEHHAEYELVVFYSHGLKPAAGYRVQAFRMDRHTTVRRIAAAMEAPELPWEEARRAVSGGLMVELVVELGKVGSIQSGDHVLAAHVAVDASGHMVSEGPIELGSAQFINKDRKDYHDKITVNCQLPLHKSLHK